MNIQTALTTAAASLAATFLIAAPGFADDVTLRFSHFLPSTHPWQASFEEWAASIEAESGGSVKVAIFPAQQLGKTFDHYDIARGGIADIATVGPGYQPGRFPVAGAANIPLVVGDGKKGSRALDEWYRQYAEKEMADVHYCLGFTQYPATIHSTKPISVPSDMKGLSLRSPSEQVADLVVAQGGTNVPSNPAESRELMTRGVIHGTFVPWGSAVLFHIDEAAKYHLDAKLNTWFGVVVLNKARYASLSDDQKKVIDNHCNSDWAVRVATGWADFEEAGRDRFTSDPGHEILPFGAEERAAWEQATTPLWNAWRKHVADAGHDAAAVEASLHSLLAEHGAAVD